jgi:hypothetical protein
VRLIKKLNCEFKQARRGSWGRGIPDLEEPVSRQVVEVAIARELKTVWGQCLYYYRLGASHTHLVLSPRLYREYKDNENVFVRENPIPNVQVYMLPDTRVPLEVVHKESMANKFPVKPRVPHAARNFVVNEARHAKVQRDEKEISPADARVFFAFDKDVDEMDMENGSVNEPGISFSEGKEEIQEYGSPPCVDCKTGVPEREMLFCKKHGWLIVKGLAAKQRLCAF